MFRSKRSGLVRRLWRSRLVTYREGRDGSKRSVEEGRDGSSCGSTSSSNPEDVPQAERRSVTQADPSVGSSGGGVCAAGGNVTQRQDDPGAIMCAPEHRGSRQGQESDSGTVTCCLFREWDLSRPRKQQQGAPTNSPKCPAATTRTRLDGIKSHNEGVEQQELKNATYALLKRLKEKALDALLKAVESKGGIPGECVLVPAAHTELRLHNSSSGAHHHHHHHHPSPISPQHLLCKVYRWADLQHTAQLKALWLCHSHSALSVDGTSPPATVCCNPYHYSRVCGPESPPPPYSLSPSDEHKPLDPTLSYTETVAPHYSNSPQIMPRDYTDTGTSLGSTTSSGRRSHWCSVAYWEQRTRVGRLYPAHEPSLSIFYDLPQGTGLCLGQLHTNSHQSHQDNVGNNSAQSLRGNRLHGSGSASGGGVQQIRSKIGYGIVLSREPDGVWVYNRSQHPVFVHSPTLDLPSARGLGLCVKRVMPGYSLKVFDYERSSWIVEHGVKPECQEGPWDPHSVRISFAKGWGPCYSRQFITSCPCWLEVLLNNHR